MRQILAVLLCAVLVLGLMCPTVWGAETEEELLEVTMSVYSDREGYLDVDGLYRDNVLYIDAETVCWLTGARIHARDERSVTFSLHDGLRHITVSTDGDGRLTEEVTMGRAYSFGADVPVVSYNGAVYASATQLLRYMGAVVGFGENETSPTHMTVSMPYTILDLIVDFTDAEGYFFSWSEADGKYVDPEDAVTLAAIDTILLGYDTNILAYAVPGHGDKIEKEYYTDVLGEILRTEGAELTDDGYNEVDLFGDASDTWSFSASWIGEVLGWIEDDTLLKNLNKSMSGALNTTGVLLSAGGDYLDSLNAAMQFANMSTHQKELLDNTLNKIPENNPHYQALPMLFEAAEEVSDMISGRYDANKKAAWDGIYSIMVNAGTSMLNSLNPFAIAWDSLTTIAKLDPMTSGLLDDEKAITYAMECHNVEIIAWNLLQADYSDLWTHNFYMFTEDTEVQEWLRLDMILALKSCLTARAMLLGTGWLTEASQNTMEMTAEWTAELLNKAQNAKPVTMGILDNREEDITWIENLAKYKVAYAEFLRETVRSNPEARFQLVYVNGDSTPELAISTGWYHAAGVTLYTYYDSKVTEIGGFGGYGTMEYAPKQNLMRSWYMGTGTEIEVYYSLKLGRRVLIHAFENLLDMKDYTTLTYYVDDEEVSQSYYEQMLEETAEGYTFSAISYENCAEITESNIGKFLKNIEDFVELG